MSEREIRGLLALGALVATFLLAVVFRVEAAAGALIGLLGLAGAFVFRKDTD